MPLRAVIDTSALVGARQRRDLQNLAEAGAFTALWSPWIIAELNRVLTWRWIDRTDRDLSQPNRDRCSASAKAMMDILLATFELVDSTRPYPSAWDSLTDRWDQPIWAAVVVGGAQCVVSDNTHDYPPRQQDGRRVYQGIEYITAQAFLALLAEN